MATEVMELDVARGAGSGKQRKRWGSVMGWLAIKGFACAHTFNGFVAVHPKGAVITANTKRAKFTWFNLESGAEIREVYEGRPDAGWFRGMTLRFEKASA